MNILPISHKFDHMNASYINYTDEITPDSVYKSYVKFSITEDKIGKQRKIMIMVYINTFFTSVDNICMYNYIIDSIEIETDTSSYPAKMANYNQIGILSYCTLYITIDIPNKNKLPFKLKINTQSTIYLRNLLRCNIQPKILNIGVCAF